MTSNPDEWRRWNGKSMGTTWTVKAKITASNGIGTAWPQGAQAGSPCQTHHISDLVWRALTAALDTVIDQMSTWSQDSTISRLNRAAPGWYQIEPEFWRVLDAALNVARLTEGAYDPTLHELVNLWGFGPAGPRSTPPTPDDLRNALLRSGWQKIQLDPAHRGVWQPGGLQFDLSSIAKGFGVDEMARILDEHGCRHYLVELGGELKARGLAPDGHPWRITIDDAQLPVNLSNLSIATSGDYRRYFEHNGRRYAHTLDARTGQPLQHALTSVTVIHPQCLMADAWATALLCLGPEHGPVMARKHALAALFLERHDSDFRVYTTDRFTQAAGLATRRPDPL